ncbi:MAG: CDP-diacylglycerol--glycerol-3-phosphate 3-phosphatidyltransferase [Candidatus Nanopelagicales bacterium]
MTHPPVPDHLGDPSNEVPLLNIPNGLTVARLFMVPIFGYLVLAIEQTDSVQWASAMVFLIAALTDLVDGVWARRYGLVTNFGKIADPIADKALIGTALIALSIQGEIAWWVTGIIIFREVAITLMRFWVIKHGVIPASRGGKVKTVSQIIAIVAFLIPLNGWVDAVAQMSLGVALALTITTGIDYVVKARVLPRAK